MEEQSKRCLRPTFSIEQELASTSPSAVHLVRLRFASLQL